MTTYRSRFVAGAALLALLVFGLAATAPAAAQDAAAAQALWSAGLFTASPREIAAAVAATRYTGTASALVLFEGGRFDFAEDGSLTKTTWLVFKILKEEAVRGWGRVSIGWSPWHQDRPVVKARVVNEDGREYPLAASSLIESAVGGTDADTYSDRRKLEGPYPQVRTGSVVEMEITTVTRPVMDGAGIAARWWYGGEDLVVASRLEIVSPAGMPLAVTSLGNGVPAPVVRTVDGRSVREYRATLVAAVPEAEESLPRDVPAAPVLYFSTAPSWERLAAAYAAIIDRTIAAKPVVLPKEAVIAGDPAGTALALVRWINERVRYVGLELGENSIVPYAPGDILARGHGDCKDKASLLVSLLRQAGYDASVALLGNDSDTDIPPGLPAMDFFNHAIVRVEGNPGLWIDPTVEWSRDIALPAWDQERWVLVARRSGGALVRTAVYDQAANENTVVLEYSLLDSGPCNLSETTVYGGGFDQYFRQRQVYADPQKTKTDLEGHVKDEYGDAKLESWTYADPKDFSRPFSLTLKLAKSYRGFTDLDDARVHIDLGTPLSWLPEALLSGEGTARVSSYRQSYPFILHTIHRIHLPAGFVLRAPPDPVDRMLGTVRLRSSSSIEPGGTVVVRYDLETSGATLTPAEFERTRTAIKEFRDKLETVTVYFDHQAGLLFADGKYREAFDLHRALVRGAPGETIHEIRLSRALLSAGLGDEAAIAARHAASIAPADAEALDNLAWVLQFDPLGRRFGRGWDRAGSIAAYEKLLALEPGRDYSRADFAIMLEYDALGARYGDPQGVSRALEQFRLIKVPLGELDMEENPVLAMMRLGRFTEMETAAAGLSDAKSREVYLLVARAAFRGASAAVAGMNKQASRETQRQYLAEAGSLLSSIHCYPEAAELFRQAARGSSNAANLEYQADFLSGVKPTREVSAATTDPVELVKAWFQIMSRRDGRELESVAKLLGPDLLRLRQQRNPDRPSAEEEWLSLFDGSARQGVDRQFFLDILFSTSGFALTGDAKAGWHVAVTSGLNPEDDGLAFVFENLGDRLLMTASSSLPASYLARARAFARAGDWQAAGRWLDWLRDDLGTPGDITLTVLKEAWSRTAPRTAESVGRALALLSAAFPETAADVRAVDALPATSDAVRTAALLARWLGAGALGDWRLGLESAAKLYESRPGDTDYRDYYLDALITAAEFDRFDTVIAALRAVDPQDKGLKRMQLQSLISRRDPAAIERFLREQAWQPDASEYNAIAWLGLFGPVVGDQALEYARKSVNLTKSENRAALHTLAALYAATGRYEDARELMEKCLALTVDGEPRDYDWYVFGMIAEGYGFPASARTAYQKVAAPTSPDRLSTWELAQKRLAGLPK
jgi:tetratricopeptide (TPR) repeat protein